MVSQAHDTRHQDWFAELDGARAGPLTEVELQRYYRDGRLVPESLVWTNGMSGWAPIAEIPELTPLSDPFALPPLPALVEVPRAPLPPTARARRSGWVPAALGVALLAVAGAWHLTRPPPVEPVAPRAAAPEVKRVVPPVHRPAAAPAARPSRPAPRPEPTLPPLRPADVVAAVKQNAPSLAPCVLAARARGEIAAGRHTFVLDWTIRGDGSVTGASLRGPQSLLGTSLPSCVSTMMLRWRFPASAGGAPVRNFPLGPVAVK